MLLARDNLNFLQYFSSSFSCFHFFFFFFLFVLAFGLVWFLFRQCCDGVDFGWKPSCLFLQGKARELLQYLRNRFFLVQRSHNSHGRFVKLIEFGIGSGKGIIVIP